MVKMTVTAILSVIAAVSPLVVSPPAQAATAPTTWLVTETNGINGNALVLMRSGSDLVPRVVQQLPTGGLGSGLSLHASGAVTAAGPDLVLAVDGRSNDIAVARLRDGRLHLLGRTPSRGGVPNSISVASSLVVVLNSGVLNTGIRISRGSVQGFRLGTDGSLRPVAQARVLLPETCPNYPGPALSRYSQVSLTPDGRQLLISDTSGNRMLAASVSPAGAFSPLRQTAVSSPYGFSLDAHGRTVVTNAGEPEASVTNGVVSAGRWRATTAPVATPFAAACWVLIDGDRAFIASGPRPPLTPGVATMTVVFGRVTGVLASAAVPVTTPTTPPLDMVLANGGRRLYAGSPAGVQAFTVDDSGQASYDPMASVSMSVPGARFVGLAALPSR